jgi:hypothetical protein
MNEKRHILVRNIDEAQVKPAPIEIVHLRTWPELKRNSDAFAVDWYLEESGAGAEPSFPTRRHDLAGARTNAGDRSSISLVLPRFKPNK